MNATPPSSPNSPDPAPAPRKAKTLPASAVSRAEAHALRRKRVEERLAARNRAILRYILLGLATLGLIALLADCQGIASRLRAAQAPGGVHTPGDAASIRASLATAPRYTDPKGRFSVAVPPHWRRLRPDPESIFDASFRGPYGLEMNIQCVVTNGLTFDKLVGRLRALERSMSADSHIAVLRLNDWKVAKRTLQLYQNKILLLDFVTGDLAHEIQFVIPPVLFDEYEPVFLDLVRDTYRPGQIIPVD